MYMFIKDINIGCELYAAKCMLDKMPCCAHVLCVTWSHGRATLGWEGGGSLDFLLDYPTVS